MKTEIIKPVQEYENNFIPKEVGEVFKQKYLDYALSVIVERALPDIKDGFIPSHRRIIYSMYENGLLHGRKMKCARIVGDCFIAGTKVSTTKGIKNIENVEIGDIVSTPYGMSNVVKLYEMPESYIIDIELENGLKISSTENQEYLILNNITNELKKTKAIDLSTEDFLIIKKQEIECYNELCVGDLEAYTLGFFLADGFIIRDGKKPVYSFGFAKQSIDVLNKISKFFKDVYGYNGNINTRTPKFTYLYKVHSLDIIKKFIHKHDLINKYAINIKIPDLIWTSSLSARNSFISGFFDGHSRKIRNNASICSISENFIRDMQLLLLNSGCHSDLTVQKNIKHNDLWSLNFNGEDYLDFQKIVNHHSVNKDRKFFNLKKKNNLFSYKYYSIPFLGKSIFKLFSDSHIGGGWYVDKNNKKFRCGIKYENGTKIRYDKDLCETFILNRLSKLYPIIKQKLGKIKNGEIYLHFLENIEKNNLLFIPIKSMVKTCSKQKTYDLQVEDDKHLFLPNQVVSSNCIGKYHPHGDLSCYNAIVGMGQDFNNNIPLIEKQGNFGSIDGDSSGAQRYTEAKLAPICTHIVSDMEHVDMVDNYDQTMQEPTLLPVEFPKILLNGSTGIAVGMASSILPHNLREICDVTIAYIQNPNLSIKELCKYLIAPDFPTGGMLAKSDFASMYETGRGTCSVRSHIESMQRGKNQYVVIKDLPFGVNKAKLIEQIADISRDTKVKNKSGATVIVKAKIQGIKDINDESDLDNNIKIVIQLEKDESPELVVNQIYKHTACNSKFSMNLRVLIDGKPKLVGLSAILNAFSLFRRETATKKLSAEKNKILKRLHIIDGMFLVFDKIEKVIKVIKEYNGTDLNKEIQDVFKLSPEQATAVLAITLKKLSKLDVLDIKSEFEKLTSRKNDIDTILSDVNNIDNIIIEELKEIKKKFGTPRKTELTTPFAEINQLDTIPEESMIITLSNNGYIKRTSLSEYKTQNRNGTGSFGSKVDDDDYIKFIKIANTHDDILFFSSRGICYYLPVYMIPEQNKNSKGTTITKLVQLSENEKISSMLSITELMDGKTLILTSALGFTKRLDVDHVKKVRKSGLIIAKVEDGDELIDVEICDDNNEILISTKAGFSLRMKATEISTIGRSGRGVKTAKLRSATDRVISMCILNKDDEILTVTERGYGKKVSANEYRLVGGHSGKGVTNYKVGKYGNVSGVKSISPSAMDTAEIVLITSNSKIIRISFNSFTSSIGRASKGCKLQSLSDGEKITAFDIINESIKD